jgi:2-methylcitrate dehydratase PrpD
MISLSDITVQVARIRDEVLAPRRGLPADTGDQAQFRRRPCPRPAHHAGVSTATKVTTTLSERLAEHVVTTRFEDLPAEVVERAKDLFVHHLSLAFAGRSTPTGARAVELARRLSAGAGTSTVVGHDARASLPAALLANTELVCSQITDDFQLPAGLHLGRVVWPQSWTLGEHVHASGRELITAAAVAYDAACALADPTPLTEYKRRPQHVFAPMAAAAAASRLLGHDRSRAARTISWAPHLAIGLVDGDSHHWGALAAQNAVTSALLAEPDDRDGLDAIESGHGLYATYYGGIPHGLEARLAVLGRQYAILSSSTKRYPASGSHIVPLDLAEELVKRHGVRAADVDQLVATLAAGYRGRFAHMEAGAEKADPSDLDVIKSLRAKLGLLLVEGEITYLPGAAHLRRPGVREAIDKIELRFELPTLDAGRIEIFLRDGRVLRDEREFTPYPKGDWRAWLRRDGERFLSAARVAELERMVTSIEEVRDVGEVLSLTVPDLDGA